MCLSTTQTVPSVQKNEEYDVKKHYVLKWQFETPIIWKNVAIITVYHIVAVYAFLYYLLYVRTLGIFIFNHLLFIASGFGVTGGAHRYWSHKSFKATLPLRIILIICYSAAGQNTIYEWVRDHRVHHKYSETNADPHNAKRGFFFSHCGWMMMKRHPDVLRLGKNVDCSDVFDDPLVRFNHRHFTLFKLLFCFILPSVIPPFLYGEDWTVSIMGNFVRFIVVANCTWSINSWTHFYGIKPYNKNIYPVDNLIVSLVTNGEGSHNFHHTFPWDYRSAESQRPFHVATFLLNFFHRLGWAYDLKIAPQKMVEKVATQHGDGSRLTTEKYLFA